MSHTRIQGPIVPGTHPAYEDHFPHPVGKASGQVSASRFNISSNKANLKGTVYAFGPENAQHVAPVLGSKALLVRIDNGRDYYDLPDGTVAIGLNISACPGTVAGYMIEDHAK